jgi:hypothetical protein
MLDSRGHATQLQVDSVYDAVSPYIQDIQATGNRQYPVLPEGNLIVPMYGTLALSWIDDRMDNPDARETVQLYAPGAIVPYWNLALDDHMYCRLRATQNHCKVIVLPRQTLASILDMSFVCVAETLQQQLKAAVLRSVCGSKRMRASARLSIFAEHAPQLLNLELADLPMNEVARILCIDRLSLLKGRDTRVSERYHELLEQHRAAA